MKDDYRVKSLIFLIAISSVFIGKAESILCYQCNSTNSTHPFQCNEMLTDDIDIEPQSCDDVFGAQYCVKQIGRFEALTLDCYQCSSETEWTCTEGDLVMETLKPYNCSNVFEAQYCVKTTGRFGGGIGTKRFCSRVHMGNYCDYVKQTGDKLTYRTCVFTCSGDGCNPASTFKPISCLIPVSILISWIVVYRR